MVVRSGRSVHDSVGVPTATAVASRSIRWSLGALPIPGRNWSAGVTTGPVRVVPADRPRAALHSLTRRPAAPRPAWTMLRPAVDHDALPPLQHNRCRPSSEDPYVPGAEPDQSTSRRTIENRPHVGLRHRHRPHRRSRRPGREDLRHHQQSSRFEAEPGVEHVRRLRRRRHRAGDAERSRAGRRQLDHRRRARAGRPGRAATSWRSTRSASTPTPARACTGSSTRSTAPSTCTRSSRRPTPNGCTPASTSRTSRPGSPCTVTAPADWQVVSNGATTATEPGAVRRHACTASPPPSR